MGLTRRTLLGGLAATAVVATAVAFFGTNPAKSGAVRAMSPPDVLAAVQRGDILLVDIRRPDEWARTGVADGAVPIDMRRPDFVQALRAARSDDAQPVALICARGVRSARLSAQLGAAGISPIVDVPEGMLGSFSGPGWLRRNLPVVAWSA